MKEFKVRFRTCNPWWADENAHRLPGAWPEVPWNEHLTERVTTDEASALDQYGVLAEWERTQVQPIKDVRLLERDVPEPDDGWADKVTEVAP